MFEWLGGLGWGVVAWIPPFLFVLTIVVFFHELGHFIVARWCGVTVKAFSVGFGPELIGFTDRKGTRWKLSAIPLGGYVKFLGDDNVASVPDHHALDGLSEAERAGTLQSKSVAQRAAIVAAGPFANFILAIVIFAVVFAMFGRPTTSARVDELVAGGAAEQAGFEPGDIIVAIDGRPVASFGDVQRVITLSPGSQLAVTVDRAGQQVELRATPELKETTDGFGNRIRTGQLGILRTGNQADVVTERYSPLQAVGEGARETWFVVTSTFSYIGGLIAGRQSADQLGGPITVAKITSQAASMGFLTLITIAAYLSVSIGLMNLLPVPMLDGGHLLFFAFEAVRGRPLSDRAQDIGFRIGFAAVAMLMIFAIQNDIRQLPIWG